MRTGGLLAVVLLASCGGGDKFTPATPPAGICALLTTDDLATILPDAISGGEYPISHGPDLWTGSCVWFSAGSSGILELYVYGATTAQGLRGLMPSFLAVAVRTPVTGLGTAAQYWEQGSQGSFGNGLWALEGSTSINFTAYVFTPAPTEAQFHPLAAKVLGQLE